MSWRFGDWSVAHPLPIGVSMRAAVGQSVSAGDLIAAGTTLGPTVRVPGARRIGVAAEDLAQVMRVAPGAEVERGTIRARTGRRFARAVSAPFAGRLAHVRSDGDFEIAPIVGRWSVRATLDGVVTLATDAEIVVDGAVWCLQGIAAYGPDAIGALALTQKSEALPILQALERQLAPENELAQRIEPALRYLEQNLRNAL